ncbi:MAG TPA: 5-guanidino-2-oxopentanoate decarboxylase [Steroidobacteraceae bacterium]|nr:5-guanidino-2-oxopentanoate decarboxylase [Steroidobacteraceae bacterium]
MKKTLGAYLIEVLEARGIGHVFGIPGVHNLELYRGLAASKIRHVAARHEQGLGFMADGYARVSGRPGICFTITGPGLTNIVTAMGQAYGDSIPLVVIASENRRGELGSARGFLHEMPDQLGVAARVAGMSRRITAAEQLPEALDLALAGAAGLRPRPAYIEIPRDVITEDASGLPPPGAGRAPPRPAAESGAVAAAARRLAAAEAPVILAGGGAVGAAAELRRLAETLGAPVVMTINGRGLLPPGHPLGVPLSPSLEAVRALIAGADAVLAVGTELGPTDYDMYSVSDFPPPPHLIRIDLDAAQLKRNARAELALLGDARATLAALLAHELGAPRPGRGAARAAAACTAALGALSPAVHREIAFLEAIRDTLPEAILVGDSTQPVYAGNLGFAAARPGSWFNSATGYGTLGYALPASTGAGLAAPGRPVVCLTGDGGIQFSLGELAVPRDVGAWTAIVVWNNHGYGEIKSSMVAVGIEPEGVDVRPPEFADIARAYGYGHRLIDSVAALERALKEFGARRQVVMLEVRAEAFE